MNKSLIAIILIALFIISSSCDRRLNRLSSDVNEILTPSLNYAGGLDNFLNIDKVRFKKRLKEYNPDRSVKRELYQYHTYDINPEPEGTIRWQDDSGIHKIIFHGDEAYELLNEKRVENSEESARREFINNYYFQFLPFLLRERGCKVSYEGQKNLLNNQLVDVLKASFQSEVKDYITSDDWYFHLNVVNGQVISNFYKKANDYILNEIIQTSDNLPIRAKKYTRTWVTDSERNRVYLVGEYWFSEYYFSEVPES